MKKTSILLASTIMILAVIVAIVGVTAAWFGNQYIYNEVIDVSSANPENGAIIVQGSASELPTGIAAVLAPAKIKHGLILNDFDGSEQYDKINVLEENPSVLDSVATQVTVTFDFVYNGAPPNPDGTTTMYIELVSVTLENPHYYVNSTGDVVDTTGFDPEDYVNLTQKTKENLANYRDEFDVSMFVTTTDEGAIMVNGALYQQKTKTEEDEEGNPVEVVYYQLIDSQYVEDGDPYKITFSMIPTTHTLNAVLNFAHVDELTPPELMDTQLFLNFKVSYESNEEA